MPPTDSNKEHGTSSSLPTAATGTPAAKSAIVNNPYARCPRKGNSNQPRSSPVVIMDSCSQEGIAGKAAATNSAAINKIHSHTSQLMCDATIRGRASAMRCFQKFLTDSNCDLDADLDVAEDDEARGEVVISYILDFSSWLKKNSVGAQGKDKALSNDTIGEYFGQVKETIKDKTQQLTIWENHEELWYSKLLLSVKNAYSSNVLEGDMPNRDPTCRAIHLKCTDGKLLQMQREWLDSQGADIDSIIKSLLQGEFNNRHCHEERLKILMVYYVVGRGGELKFLRHDNNTWDYYAHCLQSIVTRLKTRSQHPFWIQCTPFAETNYRVDFLHAFGSWASVGDGLFRMDENANGAKFWFPEMRTQKNEKIARDITSLIKKHVAKCLLSSTSSRGIRVGANTELAMSRDISNEEQRQATGHSHLINTEIYVRMNPNMGIPASLALASWENVKKIVHPPTLEALPLDANEVEALLDELFTVSIAEYRKGGSMRVLLRFSAASLIMYHPYYVNDFHATRFKLPKKLLSSMKNCGFSEDEMEASRKLNDWSDLIKEKFITENNLIPNIDAASVRTMMQTINNQSVLVNKLVLQNEKKSSDLTALRRQMENQERAHQQSISDFDDRLKLVAKQNETMIKILMQLGKQTDDFITHSADRRSMARESLSNSTSPPSLPRKDLLEALDRSEVGGTKGSSTKIPTPAIPWSVFVEHIQGYIPKDSALDKLLWTPFADSKSNKGLEIREILLHLLNSGALDGVKKLSGVPRPNWIDSRNSGDFAGLMKLCDEVLEDEERTMLCLPNSKRITINNHDAIIKHMLNSIQKRAFKRMRDLDGQCAPQTKATLGIGKRYTKWKKNNHTRSPSQQQLGFQKLNNK